MMKLRIREIAKEKGVPIKTISDKMGVASESISRIASGVNSNPKIDTLQAIADALEVSITDLFEKPSGGGLTCPNCGATLDIDIHVSGERKTPDHENIRGAEYYK